MKKQKATLKDIAKATGYSVNTVSRALRDKGDIAEQTRNKIKNAAINMGHISNTLASSLRLGYTKTIAVILGDISNPHFAIMMKEIECYMSEHGYSTFLLNTNENEDQEFNAIQSALNKNVDGIILCPAQKSNKNVEYLKNRGIAFVLIGRYFDEVDTDYVVCNDELGGYQATKLLLDSGHTKILMINGPTYISSAKERLAGYKKAYLEHGINIDNSLIYEVDVVNRNYNQILQDMENGVLSFTAVVSFSDVIAWEFLSNLRQKNIDVFKQYSIIGFDHIESRLLMPFKLTSICSYKTKMSTNASEILLQRINSDTALKTKHIKMDTSVFLGETVTKIVK